MTLTHVTALQTGLTAILIEIAVLENTRPLPMPNRSIAGSAQRVLSSGEHDPMKKTLFLVLALLLTTFFGCKDPSKWYLTGYENERFIFKHDHKTYAAVCWQSFHSGQSGSDEPADCSAMLSLPGIGQELPEKKSAEVKVLLVDNMMFWTPAGDARPRFHLKIVSVKGDDQ